MIIKIRTWSRINHTLISSLLPLKLRAQQEDEKKNLIVLRDDVKETLQIDKEVSTYVEIVVQSSSLINLSRQSRRNN